MLHCHACRRKCIPTFLAHVNNTQFVLTSPSPHFLIRHATRRPTWLPRGYATEASLARDVPDPGPALIPHFRTHTVDPLANRALKLEQSKKASLEIEVRWLKDPVKLAGHTVRLLREDDYQKALDTVRLASKYVECTVSWNHLIDYEMSKARVADAVKLYNEVGSYVVHDSTYPGC